MAEAVEEYLQRADETTSWSPAPTPPSPSATGELPVAAPARRVLGQFRNTYILVEEDEGLLLVDQHAAHERVLYDQYREELRSGVVATQTLLFPATVELSAVEAERLRAQSADLGRMGFTVESFGRDTLVVREVPARLAGLDAAMALKDLAEGAAPVADLEHRLAALGACHASVRAGMRIDRTRMERIVADLLDGDHVLTCPHGRPATLRYPLRDLERAFLRS